MRVSSAMAPLRRCPRCGAPAAAAIACTACGAPLPPPGIEPITADVPRRPQDRRSLRVSKGMPEQAAAAALPVRPRLLGPEGAGAGSDYDLESVLGEGGMGVVWSAQQAGLDREVAIKRVRPSAGGHAAQQLLAEAVLTGSLEHPGIVPVHEVGFDQDGVPFYSMRRLRGRTWQERWRGMTLREHLDVLIHVCDPVAYAHGRGVLHRDLKPGNVFLGEYGEVVVFDWGLAIRLHEVRRDANLATASGTPAYMAPEMARADGRKLGPASDVYLLGATLYEILTGEPPHPGEDVEDILQAAADNVISPAIPTGELGEIAAKAMATEPEHRFPDVRSFQRALRVYLDHQESVSLAGRAQERLATARRSGDYDDFSRAVHGYEDAVALWAGNAAAGSGLSDARLAFARRASAGGDLDLAAGLLDERDQLHQGEIARIAGMRLQRQRRRRALRALWWVSGALLLALIVALTLGYSAVSAQRDLILRIAQERDAAESALVREQAESADGRQRMWYRVLQEDFGQGTLPPLSKVVAGSWRIDSSALRAEGPGVSSLSVPIPPSRGVHVQLDVQPAGRIRVLLAGAGEAPIEIVLDDAVTVRRGSLAVNGQPLPESTSALPRRLRIEADAGVVRVMVDGRPIVARAELPVAGGRPLEQIALQATAGTVIDNLRIEVPWR